MSELEVVEAEPTAEAAVELEVEAASAVESAAEPSEDEKVAEPEVEEPKSEQPAETVVETVLAAAEKTYVALRHIIRNGHDYRPGDPIQFVREISRWRYTDQGAEPEWHESPEQLATHIEELKATGAIQEA